ncbi:hypothetical protein GCM10007425_04640 [Lysinibacillus alkalisoli]|uniref:Competence protein n=1 Tax=Lysinibacillus alkalisoli TaxID=1911548 RepID=A0A917D7S9_9BACI|nr:competence protein ComK [Lysinibacillus alkalisoli]GGG13406.1 hypothetical protein GCM10007425_04640 [Lysinibacillus alkalisoli]
MKDTYLISFNTLMLLPETTGHRTRTKIIDRQQNIIINRKPMYVIRKTCLTLGLSYEMTRKNAKNFFGNQHKLPIVVSHDYGVPCVFFPTFSPTAEGNVWIGLHAVKRIDPTEVNCTVTLINNEVVPLEASFVTVLKQFANANLLYRHFKRERAAILHDSVF